MRESVNKMKNPIFISKSVRVRLQKSVRLREYVNKEFDWVVKWGFEKAVVSRAIRLRECPLAESWLYSTPKEKKEEAADKVFLKYEYLSTAVHCIRKKTFSGEEVRTPISRKDSYGWYLTK